MARPSKSNRSKGNKKVKKTSPKGAGKSRILVKGKSYGNTAKRANRVGGPASTPSNQWVDVWARKIKAHKTNVFGSGSSKANPRRSSRVG